jgi:hypothetical protein
LNKHDVSLFARTEGIEIDSPRRSILDLPGASALWTRDEAVRCRDGALADTLGARRGRPAGVARGHLGGGTRGVRSPRGVVCVGRDGTDENDKMSSWRGQYFIFSDAPLQKSSSKARATDLRGARAGSATPRTTRASHDRTRCAPCPNERINSRDDRQRRHGPAGPVR